MAGIRFYKDDMIKRVTLLMQFPCNKNDGTGINIRVVYTCAIRAGTGMVILKTFWCLFVRGERLVEFAKSCYDISTEG